LPAARREAARRAEGDFDAAGWYELGYELEAVAPTRRVLSTALLVFALLVSAKLHGSAIALTTKVWAPEEAERHYRQALRDSPDHATAAFNLAIALDDLQRPGDAIEAYRAALATDPRLADAHYNLARLYDKAGKKAAALRHLDLPPPRGWTNWADRPARNRRRAGIRSSDPLPVKRTITVAACHPETEGSPRRSCRHQIPPVHDRYRPATEPGLRCPRPLDLLPDLVAVGGKRQWVGGVDHERDRGIGLVDAQGMRRKQGQTQSLPHPFPR
jgi:hypothetical protein